MRLAETRDFYVFQPMPQDCLTHICFGDALLASWIDQPKRGSPIPLSNDCFYFAQFCAVLCLKEDPRRPVVLDEFCTTILECFVELLIKRAVKSNGIPSSDSQFVDDGFWLEDLIAPLLCPIV